MSEKNPNKVNMGRTGRTERIRAYVFTERSVREERSTCSTKKKDLADSDVSFLPDKIYENCGFFLPSAKSGSLIFPMRFEVLRHLKVHSRDSMILNQ